MSHVDEGTLHAYLDGELGAEEAPGVAAHLTQCPACRARLEEERALIARADELLGLAAPPARAVPAFRPGDLKPLARLWWQVRWPLAWAATVLVALGVGMYVATPRVAPVASLADRVERGAAPVAAVPEPAAPAPLGRAPERRAARSEVPAAHPALPPRAAPHAAREDQPTARARADLAVQADSLAAVENASLERQETASAAAPPRAARLQAPPTAPVGYALFEGAPYVIERSPLDRDSARALLGADPYVVPDLAVRGIYRARVIGYSAVVVVEQALDSSRVVAVMTGRPASAQRSAVVVTGAERVDSVAAMATAGRLAPSARQDSIARARQAAAPRPTPAASHLQVEVRGPLSSDSLAALRRLVQPLRP
ncbi:MAG TPA: zf-HC2 domain-containing protein [Gemmatimonadales bacterium]|jgi:anti-sigma factor RsiW|nr:zf-HC2 domain-containing protein [Gemmatimonadales bacterium]